MAVPIFSHLHQLGERARDQRDQRIIDRAVKTQTAISQVLSKQAGQQFAAASSALLGGQTGAGGVGPPTPGFFSSSPQRQTSILGKLAEASPTAAASLVNTLVQRSDPVFAQQQALETAKQVTDLQKAQFDLEQAKLLGPGNYQAQQQLIAEREAQAAAARASAEAAAQGRIDQVTDRINQRYLTQIKAPVIISDAVQQMEGALSGNDPLSARSAIVKLAKILDPESVVREGEVATVEGGTGVMNRIVTQYNNWKNQGFPESVKEQLRSTTRKMAAPVLQRGLRIQQQFGAMADELGVSQSLVTQGAGFPAGLVRTYLSGGTAAGQEVDFDFSQ